MSVMFANNLDNPVKKFTIWVCFNRFNRPSLNYSVGELHFVSMAVVMKSRRPFQTQGEKIISFVEEHYSRRANPTVDLKQKSRVKSLRGSNGV